MLGMAERFPGKSLMITSGEEPERTEERLGIGVKRAGRVHASVRVVSL
jgi:hypothetical protein